jgi:tetratricopeptide (TPR) repeat protein
MEIVNASKNSKNLRVFKHLLSYAAFQFGDRVIGKSYRGRENGDRIDNWNVEIDMLCHIHRDIHDIYATDKSLNKVVLSNLIIPTMEKVLELLLPWCAMLKSDDSNRVDSLNIHQVNEILELMSTTDRTMGDIYARKNAFNRAESHCKRALALARRYKGEKKTDILSKAFMTYCTLRRLQDDYTNAVKFAEEACNVVAMAYNPVHPEVQTAAGNLIECLIHKGDFEKAEIYSQVVLDSLIDPANKVKQDSEEVACGYYNLAKVMTRLGEDLDKAETLAREAYRIRLQLYGDNHQILGYSISQLATVLTSQGDFGEETQKLHERFLANSILNQGVDGVNTGAAYFNLGSFLLYI